MSDLEEEVKNKITEIIDRIVEEHLNSMSLEELAERVADSSTLRRCFSDWLDKSLPTVIGNRLRCGCWEGGLIDRAFEAVWSDQLQKALEDRIRYRVQDTVKKFTEELLTDILQTVKSKRA